MQIVDVSNLPRYAFGHRSVLWWGTVAFMATEGMIFVLAIMCYLYLRQKAPEWPPNVRAEQAERLVLLRHLEGERAERAKLVDLLAAERAQRDAMLTQLTAVLAERTKLVGLFGQLLEAVGREKDSWRQELERHRAAADARLDEAKAALEEERAERQRERAEWREAARRWQAEAESRLAESVRKAERLEAKLGEALLAHRQALADQESRHRAERAAWVAERRGLQAKLDDRVDRMPRRRGWLARLRGR
jgi:hypothetical protein